MAKVAAIVDGYRIGSYYPAILKKYGYECVHIHDNKMLRESKTGQPDFSVYLENLVHNGNPEEIVKSLDKYKIEFVLPGFESGVELADIISEKMGLPTNGTRLSCARRDKFHMKEAVRNAGLKTVDYIASNKLKDILNWRDELNEWPVILKPRKSAGGNLVRRCTNTQEITNAFNEIMVTQDALGFRNDTVLAESFIEEFNVLWSKAK